MERLQLNQQTKNRFRRLFVIFLIVLFTTSFRVHINTDGTVAKWYIQKNDPTVWLKFCNEELNFDSTDVPNSDPLYASGTNMAVILQSVLDDFNNVKTSFFRMALYPDDPDNPPTPETGDSAFNKAKAKIRTIEVCFGDIPYYASAQASWETNQTACDSLNSDSYYSDYCSKIRIHSCSITFNKSAAERSLSGFVHTLEHELGHCVGFLHNHDTNLSIMSYVADPEEILRLQMDDKMGLTYLYPAEDSYDDEKPTLGLMGCQ